MSGRRDITIFSMLTTRPMLRLCGLLLILQCRGCFQGVNPVLGTEKAAQANEKLRTGQRSTTNTRFTVVRRTLESSDRNLHSLWNGISETVTRTERLKKEISKRQMIVPGYYEAECSDKKKCKEGKYCNLLYCEECHKEKIACTSMDQCCKGMECVYGRCEKKSKGDPGTFCKKDSDCQKGCCVLEPTINTILAICKPMLAEYHQCASVLYRKVWIGDKPDCGPCQEGLECVQKGSYGNHEICLKPK